MAIGTPCAAAQAANRRDTNRLMDEIIEMSAPVTKVEVHRKNLKKLTDDQRAIDNIIEKEDEIGPAVLHGAYRKEVAKPKSRRITRSYLQKMRC